VFVWVQDQIANGTNIEHQSHALMVAFIFICIGDDCHCEISSQLEPLGAIVSHIKIQSITLIDQDKLSHVVKVSSIVKSPIKSVLHVFITFIWKVTLPLFTQLLDHHGIIPSTRTNLDIVNHPVFLPVKAPVAVAD
jgi:hypothetical protein